MIIFEAHITTKAAHLLDESLRNCESCESANQMLYDQCGIIGFFDNERELAELKETISIKDHLLNETDRAEYGDFQTNLDLAERVAVHLISKTISPDIIIEPTCGKGNFILASLKHFPQTKMVYGIEIYKPYVWECKFSILDFYLNNPAANKPCISIIHRNVFDFDFKQIKQKHLKENILIIGNPPWVTNSMLGSLSSKNLPKKTNYKNHNGIDAITGKGNFDIAEYITTSLIKIFQDTNAHMALLVKNSVIKNILFDQYRSKFSVSGIEKHEIDSKKEFNVSVEASLLYCQLNTNPGFDCSEFNFYANTQSTKKIGWVNHKFVSNMDAYFYSQEVDGECPFVWRQGMKHDCSNVMELERVKDRYLNRLHEEFELESELVHGFLKSSDLKNTLVSQARKFTIVTQQAVGQETGYIRREYPKTYHYLLEHKVDFDARKSSIYNNKPLFSIFGIGDYAFAPYKVAISGLYKTFHFTLIPPYENKPVMLDDTCYFIGFDKLEHALYALILLNSEKTKSFLQSITFPDAKRTFTKDVLMRIDLWRLAMEYEKYEIQAELTKLNGLYKLSATMESWDEFILRIKPQDCTQMEIRFV